MGFCSKLGSLGRKLVANNSKHPQLSFKVSRLKKIHLAARPVNLAPHDSRSFSDF